MLVRRFKGLLVPISVSLGVLLFLLSIAIMVLNSKVESLTHERYKNVASELHQQMQILIDAKSDALRFIALSLAQDTALINALKRNEPDLLELSAFSERLKEHTRYKNVWFQVVDSEGASFYRSWTTKRGDSLLNVRQEIVKMLDNPEVVSTISVGKFDLAFKSMVPIFSDNRFIGIFEVIAKFNSISEQLDEKGIETVMLVDERYKEQIKVPYTGRFIDRYYIANLNAADTLVEYIRLKELLKFRAQNGYHADEVHNRFVAFFELPDPAGEPMGHFFMFKPLDEIDLGPVVAQRNRMVWVMVFFTILFVMGLVYYLSYRQTRRIEEFNHELELRVARKTEEIEHQHRFLQSVINGVPDSVMVINRDFQVILMNDTARSLYGDYTVGDDYCKCYELIHKRSQPCDLVGQPCLLHTATEHKKKSSAIHQHTDVNGNEFSIELIATPLFDKEGNVEAIIELGHDVTSHLQIQEELTAQKDALDYMAHFDSLTKLPNRVLFTDRVDTAIEHARRNGKKLGLLFIDLDRFKEINDSFGHGMGDLVLVENARRLRSLIRTTDTVSRLSGDEFAILLDELESSKEIISIAEKLVSAMDDPVVIEGKELFTTASIGISLYPDDGTKTEELLQHADAAMYEAKASGRNTFQFYTQEMTRIAYERVSMESSLRRAIERNEFVICYQPQYDARDGRIVGFEALVRWEHPELGLVPPDRFIPLAEETGLIIPIGESVMRTAIAQVSEWYAQGLEPGKVSINLSVKQLQYSKLFDTLIESMHECDANPAWIELEITEGSILHDVQYAGYVLKQMRKYGIEIAVDDFGTGYSSLAYLKQLPIGKLKIDKSFVQDIPQDKDDEAITRAIISMAKSLGLQIIAEGVENNEQQAFLLNEECYLVQGYLYSRPIRAREALELLKRSGMSG